MIIHFFVRIIHCILAVSLYNIYREEVYCKWNCKKKNLQEK